MRLRRRLLRSLATGLLAGLVAVALLGASVGHSALSEDHADGHCVACVFAHADQPVDPAAGAIASPPAESVAALPRVERPPAAPIPIQSRGRGPPSRPS